MNHKKVQYAFALFFLLFLAVSSLPVLMQVFQNSRQFAIKNYDKWMKNRKVKVVQPRKKIVSPYREPLPKHPPVVKPKKNVYSKSRYSIIRKCQTVSKIMIPERKNVEQWVIDAFPFRDEFSTFNMSFKYRLGMKQPIEKEKTFLMPNRKITLNTSGVKPEFSQTGLNKLLTYKKLCKANGTKYFVVFRPMDHGIHHDCIEPYRGLTLDCYQKTAARAARLEKLGINTFELYKAMRHEIPEDKWSNYWFMTDNHWNVDGAMLGGKLIADFMNRNCGTVYDLGYFDPDTYIRKRWKNVFLGSRGKKLSLSYADGKKEDFDILYPRFKTDLTVTIPALNYAKRGSFAVLMFPEKIHYNTHSAFVYSAFLSGDRPMIRIVNNKIPKGKKIIVIKDSYSNAMIPYLALQTREIIMLDPRHYSQKKILQTINKEKPDILFVMFQFGI